MAANACLNSASSPFVGSSMSRMSGCSSSTFASAARCCSPPERSYGCRSNSSVRRQSATICSTRCCCACLGSFCPSNTSNRSSRTVFFTNSACGFCGSTPMRPVCDTLPR